MKACENAPVRFLVIAALILGVCRAAAAQAPQPPTDAQVTALINQFRNLNFETRQDATKQLLQFLKDNVLQPNQLGMLRTAAAGDGDPEVRARSASVLQTWAKEITPIREILDSIGVQSVLPQAARFQYKFDGFFGQLFRGSPEYVELYLAWEGSRNALLAGDTAQIVPALQKLRALVNDPDKFDALGLFLGDDFNTLAPQKVVLAEIDRAIARIPDAIMRIGAGTGNVAPGPRQPVPVQGQGAIDTGRTLRLALSSAPVVAGNLDVFMPTADLALSKPPPGYQFVGEIFDLLAVDALDVTGTIALGIEYGATQLVGNPVLDASLLRIARLANGQAEILSDFVNDTARFVITGFYNPESPSSGLDQFGEFAVVQRAPEPSTMLLVGMAILGWAFCRRESFAPSVARRGKLRGVSHPSFRIHH